MPADFAPMPNQALLDAVAGNQPVVVLTGHYGVGKTNLAINLALAASAAGEQVTLADLDLVNPYFRSSDYCETLGASNVYLVAPTFAGTALDTPSVGGQLFAEIEQTLGNPSRRLIIDAGGDDAGATVLGSYARVLAVKGVRVLHVVNAFRDLDDPREVLAVLHEVERASRLSVSGIVNVSHLGEETTPADVKSGRTWARSVADAAGLPLVATCVPAWVASQGCEAGPEPLVTVERHVTAPWQDAPGA